MRPCLRLQLFVALALLAWGPAAPAQISPERWHNGIGKEYWEIGLRQSDREKMIALWDSIGSDLQSETNPLAGTYFKGGYDAGYFLRWSSKRFVLIPYFDEDLITDYSYGKVTFVDSSKVLFSPDKDLNGGRSVAKTPREWTAIWKYFLPIAELKQFGLFHAGLAEYNEFNGHCCEFAPNFLCTKVDGNKSYSPLPTRYAYFIKKPIEGRVVWVGGKRTVKKWGYQGQLYGESMERVVLIPIKVDLHSDTRVKLNMLFRLVGEGAFHQYLQIRKVGPKTSTGYVVRDGKETYRDSTNNAEKPLPPIRAGMRVTTRPWLSQSDD